MREPILPDRAGRERQVQLSRHGAYRVYLTTERRQPCDLLKTLLENRQRLVVTTPTVAQLYAAELSQAVCATDPQSHLLILNCGESTKTVDQVLHVCRRAQEIRLDREGVLLAIGGGVCTDIVTVAASWLRRGIAYMRVPTTLVGQIDASIGIKGGLNLLGKKNYLGCFHPPEASLVVPFYLGTLPERHLRGGLAEMLKMAIIREPDLFAMMEANHRELVTSKFRSPEEVARETLWRAINAMLDELETNMFENLTRRRKVDLGHTLSPILEADSGFTLAHGEAVAIDVAFSAVLAQHMGMLRPDVCTRILSVLVDIGVPIWSPALSAGLCRKGLQEAALHRGGNPNLVVPTAIGEVQFIERLTDIPDGLLEDSLHVLRQMSQSFNQRCSTYAT